MTFKKSEVRCICQNSNPQKCFVWVSTKQFAPWGKERWVHSMIFLFSLFNRDDFFLQLPSPSLSQKQKTPPHPKLVDNIFFHWREGERVWQAKFRHFFVLVFTKTNPFKNKKKTSLTDTRNPIPPPSFFYLQNQPTFIPPRWDVFTTLPIALCLPPLFHLSPNEGLIDSQRA